MTRYVLLAVLAVTAAAWVVATRGAGPGSSQEAPTPEISMEPEVSWSPERPGEGRLFRIRLTASEHTPVLGAHGTAAGEELHFERTDDRALESLAAVPVGADQAIEVSVRVVYESGIEERLSTSVPVEAGAYDHEELDVAPRFGSPLSPEDAARLDRDREIAREASRRAHRTFRIWTDSVVMPRASRVTSHFGDGRVFNGQISSRHMGLDLQGARGDTVVAAARGVVVVVEPFLLAGNVVYVNHGGGLLSGYFHLSRQLVAPGDTVEPGTPVGLVGATGRVTGPHLHWVVRYGNTSVDPRSLLEVAGSR